MTVKPLNLTLYLVLDPDLCSQSVGIVETALAAVQAGAGIVQLRAPTWKKRRMTECARSLKSALTPFHVPLIIDDHADVMLAANADGLHVGQQDLIEEDIAEAHRQEHIRRDQAEGHHAGDQAAVQLQLGHPAFAQVMFKRGEHGAGVLLPVAPVGAIVERAFESVAGSPGRILR